MSATGPLCGILLAAGSARRFGANKLLACLSDGEPVALRAGRRLAGAVGRLLVVVRDADDDTATVLRAAGYELVACPAASGGMGHSLACGVAASTGSAGWLVALADMPAIEEATLHAVVAAWREHDRIVVPRHAGRTGHPVLFPARHAAALRALGGDRGARAVLQAAADDVLFLDTADAGVLRDVDTPADLVGL